MFSTARVTATALLCLLSTAHLAQATTLSLTPSASTVEIGDLFSVDMAISAVPSAPNGLALMQIDLMFDANVVSFIDAIAGDFFTANASGGSLWSDGINATGITVGNSLDTSTPDATTRPDRLGFSLIEINFLPSALAGSIATLMFQAVAAGSAAFSVNDVSLLDNSFLETFTGATVGSVTVLDAETVQLPGTALLLSAALPWLLRRRRFRVPTGTRLAWSRAAPMPAGGAR